MFRRSDGTFFKWKEAKCGADRVWRYDNVSSWPPCVSFACPDVPHPSQDKNYQVRSDEKCVLMVLEKHVFVEDMLQSQLILWFLVIPNDSGDCVLMRVDGI